VGFFNRAVFFRHCEEQSEEAIRSSSNEQKKFDTPGKSPAYLHHRKKFRARAGNGRGFFQSSGAFGRYEGRGDEAIQSSAERFVKI
jgi:hypothetical protein